MRLGGRMRSSLIRIKSKESNLENRVFAEYRR